MTAVEQGNSVAFTFNKSKRLPIFDFVRAFAIILIVCSHLPNQIDLPPIADTLSVLSPGFALFGLSLFVFTSSYLIRLNYWQIDSIADVIEFYKRRIVRIYPLFFLAQLHDFSLF